ncbi:MAG TPA: hypothetical protein VE817_08865, partial [Candidatus Acidoferrum sp.]|nr:hypothetical protein [Candidatus Acidoferrum sp.]
MTLSSPLARTVDLDPARNATQADVAARFHPEYGPALGRLPAGQRVFHGLPFDLGPQADASRWILVDRPTTIELPPAGLASHVIVAHLCDTWRDDAGTRPAGLPIGHVVPVGEPLARYTVVDRTGTELSRIIRRRFEVNDGILGWGSGAFAGIPHVANEAIDWRGPHEAQGPGRYAPAGQSGSLTIMPGTYGANQVGVSDYVPSPTGDALLWLHAIELGPDAEPVAVRLEPLAGGRRGSDVIIAAITLFRGSASPLVRGARVQVRVAGLDDRPEVDLGSIIRTQPVSAVPASGDPASAIVGWGTPRAGGDTTSSSARIIDLTLAPDAALRLGDWTIPAVDLMAGGTLREPKGPGTIELLPAARVPVEVEIVDRATGERSAARVRF